MRDLIAEEKGDVGSWDVKLAPGSLTDLEFLAQALALSHAHRHPALVGLDTAAVLAEAGRLGLLARPDAAALGEAHALFTDLLHWQRLTIEGRFDPAAVTPAILDRLAAVTGLPSRAALEARMSEMRERVREIFERVLGFDGRA
jgi:glutamate-ammonia-ligase adenylyltransferase